MEIIFDEILTGWSAICGGQLVFQKKKPTILLYAYTYLMSPNFINQ